MNFVAWRSQFRFEKTGVFPVPLLLLLFAISLISRLAYLCLTTAVLGDAGNYAFLARD
jgi:hypothetical protein